jgi:2,5-diketo-D-gluconate reductase A
VTSLNDGNTIPDIGFGVYKVPADTTSETVRVAFEVGYRSVDTAAFYGNEEGTGQAVRESGLPREDVFITTKLWNDSQGYENALRAGKESLSRLGFDYIDLLLIHWPCPAQGKFVETFKAMQKLRDDGFVRSIGVSNFQAEHIADLPEVPAVNQIELHPLFTQDELREYHAKHAIITEAWSPIARGRLNDDPVIAKIAADAGRTPAQVILRWHRALGNVVIPKSVTPRRIRENFDLDFELTEEQVAAISGLNRNQRFGPDPYELNS